MAVTLKLIAKKVLSSIIVHPKDQEKTIASPSDIKLPEKARIKLVETAKAQGIEL